MGANSGDGSTSPASVPVPTIRPRSPTPPAVDAAAEKGMAPSAAKRRKLDSPAPATPRPGSPAPPLSHSTAAPAVSTSSASVNLHSPMLPTTAAVHQQRPSLSSSGRTESSSTSITPAQGAVRPTFHKSDTASSVISGSSYSQPIAPLPPVGHFARGDSIHLEGYRDGTSGMHLRPLRSC